MLVSVPTKTLSKTMLRTGLLLCLSLWGVAATAGGSAGQWLEKMATAEHYLNYSGTFVYIRGSQIETMQIVHGFDEAGERVRVTALTGASRELVRDGKHVYQVLPDKKTVLIEPRSRRFDPAPFLRSLDAENGDYVVELGQLERVADHYCQVVNMQAQDHYRYSYRFCMEQQSGLLLKAEVLGEGERLFEKMIFTNLSMPQQVSEEALRTTSHHPGFRLLRSAELATGHQAPPLAVEKGWSLQALPPGFVVQQNRMRNIATSEKPVQHIVATDGVASVSVFVAEFIAGQPYSEGMLRSGALRAVSRLENGFVITVVGEVPEETVTLISSALVQDKSHD